MYFYKQLNYISLNGNSEFLKVSECRYESGRKFLQEGDDTHDNEEHNNITCQFPDGHENKNR